ncbi:hypothetical protein [Spirillospora sp. NPDC048819]|uniref:hypothetical protein n=1 Tax=Spirillospora sp. NPDC048819 TaxID=3155268 RepID=UPI0033F2EFBE
MATARTLGRILSGLIAYLTAPIPPPIRHKPDTHREDDRAARGHWRRFTTPGVDSSWPMLATSLLMWIFLIYAWSQNIGEYFQYAWWYGALITLGTPLILLFLTRTLYVMALKHGLPLRPTRNRR